MHLLGISGDDLLELCDSRVCLLDESQLGLLERISTNLVVVLVVIQPVAVSCRRN